MRLRGWNGIDLAPQPKMLVIVGVSHFDGNAVAIHDLQRLHPKDAVSSPQRNFRPDRPQLRVVPTAPEAVSYPWLQRRNRGWFWAMLLESYLEALFSFSPTGCPDSEPYSERPPLTTGRMHLEFAHFSSVELLGSLVGTIVTCNVIPVGRNDNVSTVLIIDDSSFAKGE